jgi:hypothetical protein
MDPGLSQVPAKATVLGCETWLFLPRSGNALHSDSTRKLKTIRRYSHAADHPACTEAGVQTLMTIDGRTNDISIRGLNRFQRGDVSPIEYPSKLSRQTDHEQV